MIARPGAVALLACLAVGAGPGRHLAAPPLEKVTDIPLPGPAARFDYQSVDTADRKSVV